MVRSLHIASLYMALLFTDVGLAQAPFSVEGLILEERLRAERVHPALDRELAAAGVTRVWVITEGGFSRDHLSEDRFTELLQLAGPQNVRRVRYPLGFEADLSRAELNLLRAQEDVIYLDRPRVFRPLVSDIVEIVGAVDVWSLAVAGVPVTGAGRSIAVIDSGIDFGHPDLSAKNIVGANLNCFDAADCFPDPQISFDLAHGTNMAGIIAAEGDVIGVARGASLIGLKINFDGFLDVVKAVQWCCENADVYGISVINLSVGTPETFPGICSDGALEAVIDLAVEKNIAVVAGTGNSADTNGIALPACLPNTIPVSATVKSGEVWVASNYNDQVKLFAPSGNDVESTGLGGGVQTTGGTSAATATTSGAIALLQHFLELMGTPPLHPFELEQLLHDTGVPVINLPGSWRRVDVANAVAHFFPFIRGDVDGDGILDLGDAISSLGCGFLPGAPCPPCLASADADGDLAVNHLVDSLFTLNCLFVPGSPCPPPPWPVCGGDGNTFFDLGCEEPPAFCD